MKKIFAVVLAVLILLSISNVFAFAAVELSPEPTIVPIPTINPKYLPRPTPILNPPDEDDVIDFSRFEGKSFEELERVKDASSVLVSGFTEKAAIEQESIMKKALRKKRGVSKRINKLTQVQVAKDFDVDRQTIIRWESTQTEDGPNNTSNEWGYYKGLRTNPDLRDAYCKLVDMVAKYNEYKKTCKEKGMPLYTFAQYNEAWAKHNPAKSR